MKQLQISVALCIDKFHKVGQIGLFACLLNLICVPVSICEVLQTPLQPGTRTYLEPIPVDGIPPSSASRPARCQERSDFKDTSVRDLGGGISILIIPTYEEEKKIAANIMFVYHDKDVVTIYPEKFQLEIFPGEKIVSPGKLIKVNKYEGVNNSYGIEAYVEFSLQGKNFDNVRFIFPEGSFVPTNNYVSNKIKPFGFKRTTQVISNNNVNSTDPCMYSKKQQN